MNSPVIEIKQNLHELLIISNFHSAQALLDYVSFQYISIFCLYMTISLTNIADPLGCLV